MQRCDKRSHILIKKKNDNSVYPAYILRTVRSVVDRFEILFVPRLAFHHCLLPIEKDPRESIRARKWQSKCLEMDRFIDRFILANDIKAKSCYFYLIGLMVVCVFSPNKIRVHVSSERTLRK